MNAQLLVQTLVISFCVVIINLTMVLSAYAGAPSKSSPVDVIPFDPDVQQEINRIVTTLSSGNMSEDAVQKVVQGFKRFKNKPPQELLLQVLAIYGGKDEYRSNPRAEMVKRLLLSSLLQDMTSSDIVVAVAPKFEQVSDQKLQKSLRQALDMAALKNGRVDPDFEAFSAYIARNKEQPPMKLISYMYGHNPQAAVLSMSRVYGDKSTEAELANQIKGDAKAALQSLSDRSEWWAHLYVATMMEKEPYLQTPEMLKKLEQDTDPLVREKASKLNLKLIKDASQQTTNQTAAGIPQIPGSVKTNDFGTSGNAVKP